MPPLPANAIRHGSKTRAYLGIDPGAHGAAVVLFGDGTVIVRRATSLVTPADVWQFVSGLGARDYGIGRCVACLEHVTGYVAGARGTGSQMFKFGTGYGMWTMAFVAAGIRYQLVPAKTWQTMLGISGKAKTTRGRKVLWKESDTDFKNRLKAAARHTFPQEKIVGETADAFLIAHYCRLMNGGEV